MADPFESNSSGLHSPAESASTVSPNDTTDLATTCRALYIGVSGDVKVTLAGGSIVPLKSVAAGIPIPIRAKRIHATDTTATDIVALW